MLPTLTYFRMKLNSFEIGNLITILFTLIVITPYTFYKPTLGPKYVSYRPYNEFITPTTSIWPIIGIFNGFPLWIFDVWYTLNSKYAVM